MILFSIIHFLYFQKHLELSKECGFCPPHQTTLTTATCSLYFDRRQQSDQADLKRSCCPHLRESVSRKVATNQLEASCQRHGSECAPRAMHRIDVHQIGGDIRQLGSQTKLQHQDHLELKK